jgi:hypothetical protein
MEKEKSLSISRRAISASRNGDGRLSKLFAHFQNEIFPCACVRVAFYRGAIWLRVADGAQ